MRTPARNVPPSLQLSELLGQVHALAYERDHLKQNGRLRNALRIQKLLEEIGRLSLRLLEPAGRLVAEHDEIQRMVEVIASQQGCNEDEQMAPCEPLVLQVKEALVSLSRRKAAAEAQLKEQNRLEYSIFDRLKLGGVERTELPAGSLADRARALQQRGSLRQQQQPSGGAEDSGIPCGPASSPLDSTQPETPLHLHALEVANEALTKFLVSLLAKKDPGPADTSEAASPEPTATSSASHVGVEHQTKALLGLSVEEAAPLTPLKEPQSRLSSRGMHSTPPPELPTSSSPPSAPPSQMQQQHLPEGTAVSFGTSSSSSGIPRWSQRIRHEELMELRRLNAELKQECRMVQAELMKIIAGDDPNDQEQLMLEKVSGGGGGGKAGGQVGGGAAGLKKAPTTTAAT
jgi:hypothetical protein